jgi:hypothetical protein
MTMQEKERRDPGYERSALELTTGLEKRLTAYTAVAVAAGVGFLAWAAPAEAKIVYTPGNVILPTNTWFPIDLNHDGIADFSFFLMTHFSNDSNPRCLEVRAKDNQIWGRGHGGTICGSLFAAALRPDFKVGANKSYFRKGTRSLWLMGFAGGRASSSLTSGQWQNPTRGRYLGLKFTVDGLIHYGWARFNVGAGFAATLTGYAYETIPNKPIITGKTKGPDVVTLEPVSLGRLSQGASGIPAWRGQK